jgi:hypothetical protein
LRWRRIWLSLCLLRFGIAEKLPGGVDLAIDLVGETGAFALKSTKMAVGRGSSVLGTAIHAISELQVQTNRRFDCMVAAPCIDGLYLWG